MEYSAPKDSFDAVIALICKPQDGATGDPV